MSDKPGEPDDRQPPNAGNGPTDRRSHSGENGPPARQPEPDPQKSDAARPEGGQTASRSTSGRNASSGGASGGSASGGGSDPVERAAALTDYEVSSWLSLEPGEEVEWVGEPTMLLLVGTAVTGVVTIVFLVGVFILLFLPFSYLSIKHTDYVVTNRSLYVKKGILTTNIESVDLDRIQNTEFTQSFWGKQLGFGTIEISTAGSSGADISFANIENPREVRDRITRVQREFGGGRGARDGTGGGGGPGREASADQLDALVAELRATREALERVEARLRERPRESTDEPIDGAARGGPDEDWPNETG